MAKVLLVFKFLRSLAFSFLPNIKRSPQVDPQGWGHNVGGSAGYERIMGEETGRDG